MEQINKKIKEFFKTKALFCKQFGYDYSNFASKLRTIENYINKVNSFLKPLNLKIEIVEGERRC